MTILNLKRMLLVSAFGVVSGFLVFEPIIVYFKGDDRSKDSPRSRMRGGGTILPTDLCVMVIYALLTVFHLFQVL